MIYLTWSTILAFAATCLAIEITPGPNMTYLAVLGVSHGRRAGLAAVMGVAVGLLVIGLAAALGLAAVISSSPTLYEVMRWAGVIYLLWLAWEAWDEAGDAAVEELDPVAMYGPLFWRGLITNLLNPKAALFYIAVLPTFVERHRPVLGQTIELSLIYVLIATAIHASIVILAGGLRPLIDNPNRRRQIRRLLSLVLAAVAVWFAVNTSR